MTTKLRWDLRSKRNFLIFSAIVLGILPALGLVWGHFGDYSVGGTLFAIVLGGAVGLFEGLIGSKIILTARPGLWQIPKPVEDRGKQIYVFNAQYDPEGAALAERTFYVRSITELRPLVTFGSPFAIAIFLAICQILGGAAWVTIFFSFMLALSIIMPIFVYFARTAAAKNLAQKHSVRKVVLTENTFEIDVGEKKSVVPWEQITHVWETGDYLILVRSPFISTSIPRNSLPDGALEFIQNSIKSANNGSLRIKA